jgi:3-hydroxyisobutyrate dehydrogenase-like beta-hydroxyacid dehydrogenase
MNRVTVLYPGALGAALGKAIFGAGDTPITCLCGRSATTRERALAANFAVAASLEEVAQSSDIVVSLVPPASAMEAARRFAACVHNQFAGNGARPVYIEANSVAARTKKDIAGILSNAGIVCCDAAFLGPANRIGPENVMLLSGRSANHVAPIFQKTVEVRVVGDEIGQAASLKMTMAILTKALPALFLELVSAAAKQGQLGPTVDLMKRLYPGVLAFLERTLPTYPAHIERRVFELTEVRDWLCEQGQSAVMSAGAVAILERLQICGLDPTIHWEFEDLLRAIGDADLLVRDNAGGTRSVPDHDSPQNQGQPWGTTRYIQDTEK